MEGTSTNGSAPASTPLFTPGEWTALAEALRLSPRERQILEGLCNGLKDAAIAHRLSMPTNTVRSHLTRLHRKLNVNCRAGLLVRIFRTYQGLSRQRCEGNNAQEELTIVRQMDVRA